MNPNHEVISDFLDGEAFEPRALGEALADPAGRELLIDFVVLRYAAQADDAAQLPSPPRAGRRAVFSWRPPLCSWRSSADISSVNRQAEPDSTRPPAPTRVVPVDWQQRARGECEMKPCVIALTVVLLQCAGLCGLTRRVPTACESSFGWQSVAQTAASGATRAASSTQVPSGRPRRTRSPGSRASVARVGPKPLGDLGEASDGTMKKVYSAWTVQVTPTGRVGEAVTFRLQWMRIRDNGKPSTVGDDMELTLRPGQSLSLDSCLSRPSASAPSSECVVKSLSLSVGGRPLAGARSRIGAWSRSISGSSSGSPMERSAVSRFRFEGSTTSRFPSFSTR